MIITSIKAKIAQLLPEKLRENIENYIKGKAIEEVDIIFQIFKKKEGEGKVMVDVGAHFGSTLLPFAEKGWTVFAFEPDSANHTILLPAVGGMPNVIIDRRAVSDTSNETVKFFTSNVSTGISGMSPFYESHQ